MVIPTQPIKAFFEEQRIITADASMQLFVVQVITNIHVTQHRIILIVRVPKALHS